MILAVVFALAAAFSSAVNLLTQHIASVGAPKRAVLTVLGRAGPPAGVRHDRRHHHR